jgi:4-amino-4-deoxy-L-arabinose transferase-like glycosyltransferase
MVMTPPHHCTRTADSPQTLLSLAWKAGVIACAALAVFASSLFAKPFEDEYAYISQSFYADVFFSGQLNDRLWLELPAYDLQPVPKYLIGLSLRLAKLPMPGLSDALMWYKNYQPFGTGATLISARLPILFLGALGCVALFGCGVLIKDERVGILAAILLMVNPLYRLHAHRAMSDVPCEAFMLVALALGLWGLRRIWSGRFGLSAFLVPTLAGVSAGLSLLCKFNGFLGLMIVAGWSAAAVLAPGLSLARKAAMIAGTMATLVVACALFVALNPFLTARPAWAWSAEAREISKKGVWDRFLFQVDHRVKTSDAQQQNMSHNALFTLPEKTKVMVVQGFGRFSPFGPSDSISEVRFDLRQDWGSILWVPLVLLGFVESVRLGRAQFRMGQPPTAAALLIWAALVWIVVTVYLPMAWNRYMLPTQSGNALLAALAVSAAWDCVARRLWARGAGA